MDKRSTKRHSHLPHHDQQQPTKLNQALLTFHLVRRPVEGCDHGRSETHLSNTECSGFGSNIFTVLAFERDFAKPSKESAGFPRAHGHRGGRFGGHGCNVHGTCRGEGNDHNVFGLSESCQERRRCPAFTVYRLTSIYSHHPKSLLMRAFRHSSESDRGRSPCSGLGSGSLQWTHHPNSKPYVLLPTAMRSPASHLRSSLLERRSASLSGF